MIADLDEESEIIHCIDFLFHQLSANRGTFGDKLRDVCCSSLISDLFDGRFSCFGYDEQLKIMKLYDMLVQSSNHSEELHLLFEKGKMGLFIDYDWNIGNNDVIRSYFSVLKSLSLKIRLIDPKYLLADDEKYIPLLHNSISHIYSADSTVVSSSRLVFLNFCLLKNPVIDSVICEASIMKHIALLISEIDIDGLAFLTDLLDVCPLQIRELIFECLELKFLECEMPFFAKAMSLLCDSQARECISAILSKRFHLFPITDPLTLWILFFSIENKLMLFDCAIFNGLIKGFSYNSIPSFSPNQCINSSKKHCFQDLAYVFTQHESVLCLTLCLRLFEKLSNGIPSIVFSIRKQIIEDLISIHSYPVFKLMSGDPIPLQRYDIDYILAFPQSKELCKEYKLIQMVAEIESSISRVQKTHFIWFECPTRINNSYMTFGTSDGLSINLYSNEFICADQRWSIWDIELVPTEQKIRKNISFIHYQRKKNMTLGKSEKITFEFPSSNVALMFENEIKAKQVELYIHRLKQLIV